MFVSYNAPLIIENGLKTLKAWVDLDKLKLPRIPMFHSCNRRR